ncbi:sodium/potassium-transporting ATPase subunit beta-2-like isoform X5 [Hylaeus anthracinus]|uniref:sodium/potassium-transporting ATPase subunit beta-2-like isoform X5 n=1 Tax=Hylaeus anthracinus TaxID=313031 RepID=UPI0023B9BF49|nr:sodium/potassium-transporting ATPase subunit beta-2-like isoform X5 [Hylaeus anthracinus]
MSVPDKKIQNGTYELEYNRMPEYKTKWEAFRDFIHDPNEGTYCGHTGKKWAITGTFYTIFFAVLALLFAICMKGLLATLNPERPRWTLDESLIGTNPGMGFRPISDNPLEKSLIWYSSSDPASVQKWTSLLDIFLKEYTNSTLLPNGGRNQQICSYDTPVKPGHVCAVDVNNWGPCSPEQQYGFNNSAPCVFLKLNRLNTVWVSCVGYYYPYKNIPGYLSPVVAVHFLRPARNKVINVECHAWAKNIIHTTLKGEKSGSVHFELMIDE